MPSGIYQHKKGIIFSKQHRANLSLALSGKGKDRLNPNWKGGIAKDIKAYQRDLNQKHRLICLIHYGQKPPRCACCGERTVQFLSIDHIDGGGSKQRKEAKMGGSAMFRWLINNNFPPGFQILCHNCNLAKGFYGKCPHPQTLPVINKPS
jgi:hypothetical protein